MQVYNKIISIIDDTVDATKPMPEGLPEAFRSTVLEASFLFSEEFVKLIEKGYSPIQTLQIHRRTAAGIDFDFDIARRHSFEKICETETLKGLRKTIILKVRDEMRLTDDSPPRISN